MNEARQLWLRRLGTVRTGTWHAGGNHTPDFRPSLCFQSSTLELHLSISSPPSQSESFPVDLPVLLPPTLLRWRARLSPNQLLEKAQCVKAGLGGSQGREKEKGGNGRAMGQKTSILNTDFSYEFYFLKRGKESKVLK